MPRDSGEPGDEDPLESDQDSRDDGESDLVPCPFCGHPMAQIADVCPNCRSFVAHGERPGLNRFWRGVAIVTLAAILVGSALWMIE